MSKEETKSNNEMSLSVVPFVEVYGPEKPEELLSVEELEKFAELDRAILIPNNVVSLDPAHRNGPAPRNAAYAKDEIKNALHGVGAFTFSVKFRVVEQSDGALVRYIEYPNGEMKIDRSSLGLGIIAKWCKTRAKTEKCFNLSREDLNKLLDIWELEVDPVEMPPVIRFDDEKGACLRRVPFSIAHGDSPLFDDIISRMTNQKAVMAYIWSVFENDSYNQQYLWIQGEGQDGKGSLARWFEKVLSMTNFISMSEMPKSAKYLSHTLIGKRLAVIADNRDQNLPNKNLFISITGGDMQLAENKYIPAFMARLNCKFIVLSNPDPNVADEKALLRRLIFSRITSPREIVLGHNEYENGLYAESGAFLAKCRDVYQELCPNHEKIVNDGLEVTGIIEQTEAHFAGLFESRFRVGGEIRAHQLAEIVRQLFNNKLERDDFYKFIRRKLKTKAIKDHGLGVRIWKGFSLKNY